VNERGAAILGVLAHQIDEIESHFSSPNHRNLCNFGS